MSDEELVLRTHGKVMVPPAFGLLVLIAAVVVLSHYVPGAAHAVHLTSPRVVEYADYTVFGLALIIFLTKILPPFVRWRSTVYYVNTHTVRVKSGLLSRNVSEIPSGRITEIRVEQGILDRIFGCGTLVLEDAADGRPSDGLRLNDVRDPFHVRDVILRQNNAATDRGDVK